MKKNTLKEALISRLDLIILLSCLLVTYGGWQWGIRHDTSAKLLLTEESQQVQNELSTYMHHLLDYNHAIHSLYVASEKVVPDELSIFIQTMMEGGIHPAILRFSIVEKVEIPDAEPQFIVKQVLDQTGKHYTPSLKNLMDEPKRKALITKVVESRKSGVAWVDHVGNIEEYGGAGFVMSTPIYKGDELIGLVNLILNKEAIAKDIGNWVDSEFYWQWWVQDEGVVATMTEGRVEGDELTEKIQVTMPAGSVWGLDISRPDAPSEYWKIVVGLGIVFSFMIYAMVYSLNSSGERAKQLALQMTIDLKKYKLALDSASNHIVITDANGVVIYANAAAQKLTGFSMEEMIGKTPRLWGGQMDREFYAQFWQTIKTERKVYRGVVTNKRKNGELYSSQASVSPIIAEDNELIGFVGVEEDVTEESKNRKKLEEFNATLRNSEAAMVNLLEDSKELEKQLATEKKGVEKKVEERTKELADEKAKLMASIGALPRAFLIVDTECKIVAQNGKLEGIFGQQNSEWSLKLIDQILGSTFKLEEKVRDVLKTKKIYDEQELQYQAKFLRIYMAPVLSQSDEIVGVVVTIKDATEARVAARSKDEFFSIASHELRTPLTAIRGNTSMMLDYYGESFKDPELKQMLNDTHDASVRLIGIVNDFLDMSRLEMSKVQFKIEAINLEEVIKEVIKEYEVTGSRQKLSIELIPSSEKIPSVMADRDRLKQVFINLLGNAIKFTKEGGIKIELHPEDKNVAIWVIDTGTGIPLANQGLLFHKFQQAGSSLATRDTSKGTGLGLYISRLLAEGMGGKLELIKSEEGKGSVFGVTLPTESIK